MPRDEIKEYDAANANDRVIQKMMVNTQSPAVTVSLTFFLRAMEWAKEDASDDNALHQFTDGTFTVGMGGHVLDMEDFTTVHSYVRSGMKSSEPERTPGPPAPAPAKAPVQGKEGEDGGMGRAAAAATLGALARVFAQEEVEYAIDCVIAGEDPAGVLTRLENGDVGEKELGSQARKNLPDSAFAGPGRSYPIHDLRHARAALAMVAGARSGKPASAAVQARVRKSVYARYPQLKKKD